MKQLYIVGWPDGSFSDPVTLKEAKAIQAKEPEVTIDRQETGDWIDREYEAGYAYACGYYD